jgi:hypothetical protein
VQKVRVVRRPSIGAASVFQGVEVLVYLARDGQDAIPPLLDEGREIPRLASRGGYDAADDPAELVRQLVELRNRRGDGDGGFEGEGEAGDGVPERGEELGEASGRPGTSGGTEVEVEAGVVWSARSEVERDWRVDAKATLVRVVWTGV